MLSALICVALAAPKAFTLVCCGDIMLNAIPVKAKPLAPLKPLFATGNVVIANLEIPLTNSKTRTTGKTAAELKKRTQFILKADPAHAPWIARSGVQLVSLGNNHAMDYGPKGLFQMLHALDKAGIQHAGADGDEIQAFKVAVVQTKGGVRIGLISAIAFVGSAAIAKLTPATPDRPGIAALQFNGVLSKEHKDRLAHWISEARRSCDFVVVGLHWGIERQTIPTAYQVNLGRACIDAGADLVWGNHPHVLEGAELYNGKPILYSMGNLISVKQGATALARLYFKDGHLDRFRILPCRIAARKVSPVPEKAANAGRMAFKRLSLALIKRFPNKSSKPLY